jgi:hypothetical protein
MMTLMVANSLSRISGTLKNVIESKRHVSNEK